MYLIPKMRTLRKNGVPNREIWKQQTVSLLWCNPESTALISPSLNYPLVNIEKAAFLKKP